MEVLGFADETFDESETMVGGVEGIGWFVGEFGG